MTSTCPYGIVDGHAQDKSSVLVSPIYLGMSGTLLAVNCPESFVVVEFVESKTHPHQAGTLEF